MPFLISPMVKTLSEKFFASMDDSHFNTVRLGAFLIVSEMILVSSK